MDVEEVRVLLETTEGEYDLENVQRLFTHLGYTKEAEEISDRTKEFIEGLLKEYPHVDTNDLVRVINNALDMPLVIFCSYRRFLSKQAKEAKEKVKVANVK